MRSVLARLALAGLVATALVGCGSGGQSLPTGAIPNNSGGGSINVGSQNPPGADIAGILIDGGVVSKTDTYSGINNTATDTQSAVDAGTDPKTGGSGAPPVDPAGSHSITFTGSGVPQIIFVSSIAMPALYYSTAIPGQLMPVNYGAIVLYALVTPGATAPGAEPKIAIELTGGSSFTSYDVRSTCGTLAAKGATPGGGLVRYVCALPAYGATSGTTASVTLTAASGTTAAVTTSYTVDTNIANPRTADPTGAFVPAAGSKLYAEIIYGSPTPSASSGTLALDYLYAEAGTK
jgi:hypothetical protein